MATAMRNLGQELAERLGIVSLGIDGRDIKAKCIACPSSDAMRIHRESGVAFCHSCQSHWSRLELATAMLGDQRAAWDLLATIGLEEPRQHHNGNGHANRPNPLELIAKQKGVTPEAFKAFGAVVNGNAIKFLMYGPDAQPCSTFRLTPGGGKGLYQKGKPTGLFLANGKAPAAGEIVLVVEGVKDSAALAGLGYQAVGLPSNALPAKFARLFRGVNVVLVPDRDRAGTTGAEKTARVLFGVAASIKIAQLPAEYRDSKGDDVRDVLKRPNGESLVRQAIADAQEWKPSQADRGLGLHDFVQDGQSGVQQPLGDSHQAVDNTLPSLLRAGGMNEIAQSKRLVERHGQDFRYIESYGKFVIWDNRRWALDKSRHIEHLAKQAAEVLWDEVPQIRKAIDGNPAAVLRYINAACSARGVRACVDLVRSVPGVVVGHEVFDCDPWLLNVENGTLDLRTGNLREHRRDDHLTKLAPVRFDPNADCPVWCSFIRRITAGNDALAKYLRRGAGYSLTGTIRDHALMFPYGIGANGKSTFTNTLLSLLGDDYAMKAPAELLMAKHSESHPTERADLCGKRLVVCNEPSGNRLNESLVKELCGGDSIRARRMREDFWEFRPTHKVWLCANHRPIIRGTDDGIWRRIKLIPFTVQIPAGEQDKSLAEKLLSELPGILNWALLGCLEWQREGLNEPESVIKATGDYRAEMDVLGEFISDCCVVDARERTKSAMLYDAYVEWSQRAGENAATRRGFGQALTERGFERFANNGTWYRGIGLVTEPRNL